MIRVKELRDAQKIEVAAGENAMLGNAGMGAVMLLSLTTEKAKRGADGRFIARKAQAATVLKTGQLVTIKPGAYSVDFEEKYGHLAILIINKIVPVNNK